MGEIPSFGIKERIMGELVQGKAKATQLQVLLRDPVIGRSALAHGLVANILGSFTESLSMLGSRHPPPKRGGSETEGSNKKRSASLKEKRGCYKRRKSRQTRTTVTSTIEDDHSWRKYGQKEILNSKYPRSYFRCTHKYDKNCTAIKQVQKTEEDPRMYEITYINVHTCTDGLNPASPQMSKDSATRDIQSFDALSGSNSLDIKGDLLFNSTSTVTALAEMEEAKEDANSKLTDIVIDSLLMGDGDLPEGSPKYQGFRMDFLMNNDSCNLSRFAC